MARGSSSLVFADPSASIPGQGHHRACPHSQLRDVIICPRERGIVNYVQSRSIVEHNILEPEKQPRTIADLAFLPNTLASLQVPGTDHTLLAAGGQDAEIHLSLLAPESKSIWQFNTHLEGSINNSILLTSLSLTDSNESSVEPRMAVSNNDRVVMFFDVPVRSCPSTITQVGAVRFNVPINHSSISPDGRTLLSVGDSSKVFLHRLTGGAHITASPIATLTLPPTANNPFFSPALVASFSTAFSADGSKYAVASQEGSVAVWDVRSTRPLRVFPTDKTRGCAAANASTTWLSEDPVEWSHRKSRGPGWSARNVKFGGRPGREIMLFTEVTPPSSTSSTRAPSRLKKSCTCPPSPRPPPAPPPRTTRSRYGPPPPPSVHRTPLRARYQHDAAARLRVPPRPLAPVAPHRTIARTLEDAFRVAAADDADVLVIPALGDRAVEREVRRVLGHHGVPARFRREDDAMDVDAYAGVHAYPRHGGRGGGGEEESDEEGCEVDMDAPPPPMRVSTPNSSSSPETQMDTTPDRDADRDEERNIAGACFDPHGAYIYVASDTGVAEWGVRGAEKRWWVGGAWER
ncbi:DUF2415 domain-containing protein [Mycena sanguinolenta]|uniref:DUF2415 domain-containing protein n=1 Tax=Mycena sanguinolenta TaxID=230812 RepID=A0A8H6Z8A6_9AGAR|nr:DUF2415 domain-containing protein [Mycena sanguinolenta]